jgi:integrase
MPYKLVPPGKRRFWYVRGTINRQRFEVSTGQTDRRRAETWAASYVAEFGSDTLPDDGPVVFDRAAAAFLAWRKPSTADERLIMAVAGWFAGKPLTEIRHAHAVEAANALRPKAAGPTKNRKVIVPIAAVMHYAAEQGWVEYRRFKKFKEARRSSRQPASDMTVSALMAAVDGHKRAILAVLYETGLRITDAINIEWAALNLPAGRLRARVGKTDERIAVALSAPLVALLANLPKGGRFVFPWRTRRGVYRWLKPLRERLGVLYTPHQSRHALATAALEAGIPDREAADLGAWRDARSLHRYQHVRASGVVGRSVGNLVALPVANQPKALKGKR